MLQWAAEGGTNVSERLRRPRPSSILLVFSSQKVSTCTGAAQVVFFFSPPNAISSTWCWNSVFRTNTCQNETGHLVPLPGEHSISRTCKYRGPSSSTFWTEDKVGWSSTCLCALHIAVLLPLPATPFRHQATGGAVTGKYACCTSLKVLSLTAYRSQSQNAFKHLSLTLHVHTKEHLSQLNFCAAKKHVKNQ